MARVMARRRGGSVGGPILGAGKNPVRTPVPLRRSSQACTPTPRSSASSEDYTDAAPPESRAATEGRGAARNAAHGAGAKFAHEAVRALITALRSGISSEAGEEGGGSKVHERGAADLDESGAGRLSEYLLLSDSDEEEEKGKGSSAAGLEDYVPGCLLSAHGLLSDSKEDADFRESVGGDPGAAIAPRLRTAVAAVAASTSLRRLQCAEEAGRGAASIGDCGRSSDDGGSAIDPSLPSPWQRVSGPLLAPAATASASARGVGASCCAADDYESSGAGAAQQPSTASAPRASPTQAAGRVLTGLAVGPADTATASALALAARMRARLAACLAEQLHEACQRQGETADALRQARSVAVAAAAASAFSAAAAIAAGKRVRAEREAEENAVRVAAAAAATAIVASCVADESAAEAAAAQRDAAAAISDAAVIAAGADVAEDAVTQVGARVRALNLKGELAELTSQAGAPG